MPLARSGSTTAYSTSLTALSGYVAISPYTSIPYMDGAGAAGSNAAYSRGDHVHPSDTSKLSLSGGVMTGPLTLAADATAALQAVTKQQLDALTTAAGYAPLASPVFTGNPQAPTPAAGDSDTSLATTQFVQSAIAPYSNNAGRNLIHNGRFDIQQRGLGPWNAGGYTADRWYSNVNTDTDVVNISAQSDAGRAQIGDESCRSVLSIAVTGNAAASAFSVIAQPIEDVRRLAGKVVTVSFYAAASAALKFGVNIMQSFGTGGSASAAAWIGIGQSVTLSTTWTRYSVTFSVPSIAGKTVGTNNDHATNLWFWMSSGSGQAANAGNIGVQSGTFLLWGVQLEVGSVATPLARRDPADELQLCQRFFETSYPLGSAPGAIVSAGASFLLVSGLVVQVNTATSSVQFAAAKRAAPTVTYYSPVTGVSGRGRDYQNNTDINVSVVGGAASTNGTAWTGATSAATGTVNIGVHWAASADL